ncbi:MAG: sigma 54-interacting transcriptional regulator [Syntrophobacteraceae bacterium]
MNSKEFQSYLKGLDEQKKDILHTAALFDDQFSLDSIIAIIDIRPSTLLALIHEMLNHGIIANNTNSIKGPFSFTHKQFISAINSNIDDNRKQVNILKTAAYLEQKAIDQKSYSLNLARLYLQIDSKDKRFYYTKKAADLMLSIHKPDNAISLWDTIIDEGLSIDSIDSDSVTFMEAIISLLSVSVYIKPTHELKLIIDKVQSLCTHFANKGVMAVLEICVSILLHRQGSSSEGSLHCIEGSKIAQEVNDANLHKIISSLLGLSFFCEGRIDVAVQVYENSLPDIDKISMNLHESWSYLILAWCYGITGRIPLGLGLARAIMQRAKLKGYLYTESFANGVISLILLEVRRLKEAEPHINNAIEIADAISSDYLLHMMKVIQGYLEYDEGRLRRARELLDEGIPHLRDTVLVQYPCSWFIELVFALHKVKWEPNNTNAYTKEINWLVNSSNVYIQGTALRYYAISIPMSDSNTTKIEQLLKKSYKLLGKSGAVIEAGRTEIELAKFYVRVNDTLKAKKFAKKAYRTLSEIDEALFPSQLSIIIPRKSKDYRMDRGVSEIVSAIDSFPDMYQYFDRIVTILSDMFGAERSAVLIRNTNSPKNTYKVMATHNFIPEEIKQFEDSNVQKTLLSTIKTKDLITISDKEKHSIFDHLNKSGVSIRSLVIVPIMLANDIAGIIFMDNRLLSGRLSDNEVVILNTIATQIAIAIQSYDIYSKVSEFYSSDLEGNSFDDQGSDQDLVFPDIIRKSKAMEDVLLNVRKVAATDTTILIFGDTGVGKELVAHAIHQYSNRSNKNFIAVNISALTVTLIESELFGYEKGAFTGAVESKVGKFELANGGTIFLDEIGELSMDVQVKLLRVLQEGSFERVGSSKSIRSDFRLITATNKNLHQMVQRGEFRSDLFYRLNSFPIEIPSLRERKEDILPLALHFMKEYSMKYNKKIRRIGKSEMEKLLSYSWPGNVRELEHTIERAIILSDNEDLQINEFLGAHMLISGDDNDGEALVPLEEVERDHIMRVLEHTRWRIRGKNGAAGILGLKPTTLEFRMRKIGIK